MNIYRIEYLVNLVWISMTLSLKHPSLPPGGIPIPPCLNSALPCQCHDYQTPSTLTSFCEFSSVIFVLYSQEASEYWYISSVAFTSNLSRNAAALCSSSDWAATPATPATPATAKTNSHLTDILLRHIHTRIVREAVLPVSGFISSPPPLWPLGQSHIQS